MLIKLIMLMKTLWLLQGEHCIERHPVPVDVTLASLRIPQMTSFNKKHYRTNLAMCKAARYRNGGSGKSCSESVKYVKRMRKPQNSFCITEKKFDFTFFVIIYLPLYFGRFLYRVRYLEALAG